MQSPVITFDRPLSEAIISVHDFLRTKLHLDHVSSSDLDLFTRAFTTPGYGKEHGTADYERLEFLGDAFIHHRVSRRVFDLLPKTDPGRMTKICDHLWNNRVYPERLWASGLNLTELILIPSSEASQKPGHVASYVTSVTSDCFEALVGALELTGNTSEAERVTDTVLLDGLHRVTSRLERKPVAEWDAILNKRAKEMEERFRQRVLEALES